MSSPELVNSRNLRSSRRETVGATAAPKPPSTRAGCQDYGSLHKLPHMILYDFHMILYNFDMVLYDFHTISYDFI